MVTGSKEAMAGARGNKASEYTGGGRRRRLCGSGKGREGRGAGEGMSDDWGDGWCDGCDGCWEKVVLGPIKGGLV